jgi:hypothetical protein
VGQRVSVLFVFWTWNTDFGHFSILFASNKPEKWKVAQLFALVCTFLGVFPTAFPSAREKSIGKSMVFFQFLGDPLADSWEKWRKKHRKTLFFAFSAGAIFGGYFALRPPGKGSKNGVSRNLDFWSIFAQKREKTLIFSLF